MVYIYYCERCGIMFEVDVDADRPVPPEAVCPRCGYPHALKAFAAAEMQSECGCGPVGGGRSAGGG